jgi:nitroimidazol reductase NimA-like FMN-containing flavoprotein (pyridoxamine 5'-phosphate oxidase superfamily)
VNAMKLSKRDTDFIKAQGVARLSTVSSDRIPHNVPVCPLLDRGKVYVASEKEARKVKNIKVNPWATIVFDEYRDSWTVLRGVMLQCQTRIVDEKEFKKIRRKLYAKYPKYESEAPMEPEDSVVIELAPEKKFSWGFK